MKGNLFNLFMFWVTVSNKYDRLKSDPEKREKSVSLGVQSLTMSISGILASVGFAVLAYYCFSLEGLEGLLTLIFGLICAVAAVAFFVQLVLASIVYAIYQVKLNKHPLGIISLVVSLLILVATVVAVVVVLTTFDF